MGRPTHIPTMPLTSSPASATTHRITGAADYISGPTGRPATEDREPPYRHRHLNYVPATGWLDTITGPEGTRTFDYDTHGRLTTDGTTSYTYNAANQMTSETTAEPPRATATTARAAGSAPPPGRAPPSTWDPLSYQLTAETDGAGPWLGSYHLGLGTFGFRTPAQGDSVHHVDVENSVWTFTGPDGSVDETTSYEPFGPPSTTRSPTTRHPAAGWLGRRTGRRLRQHPPPGPAVPPQDRPVDRPRPGGVDLELDHPSYPSNIPTVYFDPSGLFSLTGAITSGLDRVNSHSTAVTVVSTALTFMPLHQSGTPDSAWPPSAGPTPPTTPAPSAQGACGSAVGEAALTRGLPSLWGNRTRRLRGPQGLSTVGRTAARACSFCSSTAVLMADGTKKPIEDVTVGDKVIATSPRPASRSPRKVTHVWYTRTLIDRLRRRRHYHYRRPPLLVRNHSRFDAPRIGQGEKVLGANGLLLR